MNYRLILILLSFFLFKCKKDQNNQYLKNKIEHDKEDFIGVWENIDNPRHDKIPNGIFTIEIQEKEKELVGKYCAITQKGNRIDCSPEAEYNLEIKYQEHYLMVNFHSFFGAKSGKAKITLENGKINWEITQEPHGEYYAPKTVLLDKKIIQNRNEQCFKDSKLKLPYDKTIDIKEVEYNKLDCNIDGVSNWLCGENQLRYISLFKLKDVNIILTPMDCGDSPYRFYLLTVKNNKVISNLYVEGVLTEPEKVDDLEHTSFEMDALYIIKVKTKNVNGETGVNETKKYRITEEGKIVPF